MTWYDILHWGLFGWAITYGGFTAYSIYFIISKLAKGGRKEMANADVRNRIGFIITGAIIGIILVALAHSHLLK